MKNNRLLKIILTTGVVVASLTLTNCKDPYPLETTEEKAQKAAKETCECVKEHTYQYCEDKLNKNYAVSDDFIKSFNEVNNCDLELKRKITNASNFVIIH